MVRKFSWPNNALQRTRFAPLRSPLSFEMFGATRALLILVMTSLAFALPGADSSRLDARRTEIRGIIKSNLHFSIHCWCRGPDDRTVQAALRVVHDRDIPVLADLLNDSVDNVAGGARLVLEELALRQLAVLRQTASLDELSDPEFFPKLSTPALDAFRSVASSSQAKAAFRAGDALIQIKARELVARQKELAGRERLHA